MDLTGPIFALIALAWLAYLVPAWLRRREGHGTDADVAQDLTAGAQVVHSPVSDEDTIDESLTVSTPYLRRSALAELARAERVAARRRRRVLIGLGVTLIGLVVTSALHRTPWWSVAIPGGLLVLFVVVARFSVTAMRASLDRRAQRIMASGDDVEDTICFEVQLREQEREVEISAPIPFVGSLWDPVPVTHATYVQEPLAPRTVRTIDLSAPQPVVPALPPTAEGPLSDEADWDAELPRAVGE